MFANKPSDQLSLEDLANDFCEQHGISISKQGLHERFNDFSVGFMSELLKHQLSQQLSRLGPNAYSRFNRIRIKDSTRFCVPKEYASIYKGQGGIGTEAQISIQYEYDILTGKPIVLELTSACRNDQKDSKETLNNIEKDDLLIRDLAYTSQEYIQHISKSEAFYLNRLNTKWKILDKGGSPIDFLKITKYLTKHSLPFLEVDVQIAIGKNLLNTRLIISKVDASTYAKRLAKAQIAAKSKGYQVTDKYKTSAALNLFITNIPKDWLKAEQVRNAYSLRWQIELVFKVWKSQANINKVKAMKIQRFQCQLIAQFLWLLLHWKMLGIIQQWLTSQHKEEDDRYSVWKFYKVAYRLSNSLRQILLTRKSPNLWIEQLFKTGERQLLTETKNDKKKNDKLRTQKILFMLA
jgi:hypothetical protein